MVIINALCNWCSKSNFTNQLYIFLGKESFQINCDLAHIRLTTQTGAPIPKNHFANTIQAAGGYFVMSLWVQATNSSSVVTPNDIKSYLISVNAESVLNENQAGTLSEKSRRLLIRHITNFQTSRFGSNPTAAQKQAVATATGFVFQTISAVSES